MMKVRDLQPTDQFAYISETQARLWTGKTERGTVVHFYVVAVAVPIGSTDEDVQGLIEIFPSDPMIVTSEQLGLEDTTFRN